MIVEMEMEAVRSNPRLYEMWKGCEKTIHVGYDMKDKFFSYTSFKVRDERVFLSCILGGNLPYKRLATDESEK